jgi:serine/threonine protein kinase
MKEKITVGMRDMHRDLKPVNILLDWQYEVHIGDLGSATARDLHPVNWDAYISGVPRQV